TGLLLVSVAEALDQDWNNNVGTQEFRRSACGTTGNNPKGWQSETGWARGGKGSRTEARGIRNIRAPNFGLRLSRMSRASRVTGCGPGEPFQHPAIPCSRIIREK